MMEKCIVNSGGCQGRVVELGPGENQGGLLKKGDGNVERGLVQARGKTYPTEGRALTDSG